MNGVANLALARHIVAGEEEECCKRNAADQVPEPNGGPDAHHAPETELSTRPAHDHQAVAGKQLRAGEDDVIAETRSLFAIGEVRDVPSLTAAAVTLALLGRRADVVYARGTQLCAHEDGVEVPVALGPRCRC